MRDIFAKFFSHLPNRPPEHLSPCNTCFFSSISPAVSFAYVRHESRRALSFFSQRNDITYVAVKRGNTRDNKSPINFRRVGTLICATNFAAPTKYESTFIAVPIKREKFSLCSELLSTIFPDYFP